MSRYNHKHKLSFKEYLYRILFSVIAIALLVLFMPSKDVSVPRYKLNEPWEEDALIAQDSFPIFKSETQLRHEQDSLKEYYETYFLEDKEVLDVQLAALKEDFSDSSMQGEYYSQLQKYLSNKLSNIYDRGILSADADSLLRGSKPKKVIIYYGNTSSPRDASVILTEKEAYEYIAKDSHYNNSILRGLDLRKYVKPNLTYDKDRSEQQHKDINSKLDKTKGIVRQGEKIVDKGQIVDANIMDKLVSLNEKLKAHKLSTKEKILLNAGRILYATILVFLLLMYFQQFRSDYLDRFRTVLLVMTHALLFPIITYLLVASEWADVYIVPYCMLPIMLRIALDSRTAFVTHIITILACAFVVPQPFIFVVTQTVAGLVAIYSLRELTQRYELFRTAILVTLVAMLTLLCLELMRGAFNNYQLSDDSFFFSPYLHLIMAGVLTMLAYLLLIPLERVFGFTSIVTLVELQNVNNPLLRRLSENANGTFNHSMQVANLAAEVANKLGAKAQLVRTGALYHDIGKLEDAVYFTENQNGRNPHDGMPFEDSAHIIIQHVENGLRLADKYKLPAVVKDFIATHHGKSLTKYFYIKAKEASPMGAHIATAPFTYPGPKPQTLEQAILMMADSVEAASRSLPEYTEESISALVEKIVGAQVSEGSFDECPITFRAITEAKEVLVARLRTVYHTRIQYPE